MLLSLSHASIQSVVRQRYIKSVGSDHESRLHRLLAGMSSLVTFTPSLVAPATIAVSALRP